jgi:drug/metabolite transporter (DMT)-like permease
MKVSNNNDLSYYIFIFPICIMLAGQIFAKLSGNLIGSGGSILNIYSLFSYSCLISRGLLWIFIIRRMRLVFAYPVMSINYVLVLIVSHYYFHEKIQLSNLIGSGLITMGIIFIGLGERHNRKCM